MVKKKQTYQSSLEELETIIDEMNSGEVSIDALHTKVKRAKELLVWCKEKLRSTQSEIETDI